MKIVVTIFFMAFSALIGVAQRMPAGAITIKRSANFKITGDGKSSAWDKAAWIEIPLIEGSDHKPTRLKTVYSDSGIYFLFHCQDEAITAKRKADFDSLWLDDVVEAFLWPDTTNTLYLEYELSPHNLELPILIPNFNGRFLGWRPWLYEGIRKAKHQTSIVYDPKNKEKMIGWIGEFFIPYALMAPLGNVPAKSGMVWRANFYRVDYDSKPSTEWAWKKVTGSFHQYKKFGYLLFE